MAEVYSSAMVSFGNSEVAPKAADRTVTTPFTTPLLCGTKARADSVGRIELMVPNPAGGASHYIIALGMLRDYCHLSLHDELLLQRLMDIPYLAPSTVRQAVRDVAMTGAAGHTAAIAAKNAIAEEAQAEEMATYLLIVNLLKQSGIVINDLVTVADGDDQRRGKLRKQLSSLAPKYGLSVDQLFGTIQKFGRHASLIGVSNFCRTCRHQQTLDELNELIENLTHWSVPESGEAYKLVGRINSVARNAHVMAKTAVEGCRQILDDIDDLIQRWRRDEDAVCEQFIECDWLLDGWRETCGLWTSVAGEDRSAQRETLISMVRLMPLIADDRYDRSHDLGEFGERPSTKGWIRPQENWRVGLMHAGLQARAENVLAVAL